MMRCSMRLPKPLETLHGESDLRQAVHRGSGNRSVQRFDVDLQLKTRGIRQLVAIGLLAHTSLDSTVRFGAELGYQVTVVKDATASFTEAPGTQGRGRGLRGNRTPAHEPSRTATGPRSVSLIFGQPEMWLSTTCAAS